MDANVQSAIERYTAAADVNSTASFRGDADRSNAAYEEMIHALHELDRLTNGDRSFLLSLLAHPRGGVRVAAATHLLKSHTKEATRCLKELASGKGMIAFEAETTLAEWKAGRLNPP